jgi:hypothetical protein
MTQMEQKMQQFSYRRMPMLIALLVFGLAALGADKPNFSGEWKLNAGKSDFGPLPTPTSRTDKIDHKDPTLKVSTTQVGQQGEIKFDFAYTTDGKECTNTVRGNPVKSTVKWDGDVLNIDSKGTFNQNEVLFKDKWTLSEDGKILSINRHLASQMGELDQKIILEKQ